MKQLLMIFLVTLYMSLWAGELITVDTADIPAPDDSTVLHKRYLTSEQEVSLGYESSSLTNSGDLATQTDLVERLLDENNVRGATSVAMRAAVEDGWTVLLVNIGFYLTPHEMEDAVVLFSIAGLADDPYGAAMAKMFSQELSENELESASEEADRIYASRLD